MFSQVIGWIELDEAAGADADWHGLLSGARGQAQNRFAGARSRLGSFCPACSTECVMADVEQLQADLQAEFDSLRQAR